MRIGVDGTVFVSSLTGIGNYGYHLLKAMAAQAPEHEFIVFTQQPLTVEFAEPNIAVHLHRKIPDGSVFYWKVFGMARACASTGVDVFWAVSGVAPFFMHFPVVLTVFDFVYLMEPQTMSFHKRWFRRLNQPWWIARADKAFSISRMVGDEMRKYCVREPDAVVLPAAADSFFRQGEYEVGRVRSRYGLEPRFNLIVGTLEPRKNVYLFVKQYLDFSHAHPAAGLPPLALIGGKGWNDREILRVLEEAERLGAVRRLGYVPVTDLPGLYSAAELFFMPSRYEGFGMPILEARKCGCPVVCSDIPAMREAGGVTTLYHPPTAEGIRYALEEVYLRGHMPVSDQGGKVDWSWASGAAEVLSLLEHAVAEHPQ